VVVTQAPLDGEQPFIAVFAQGDATRADVRAAPQMARANGDLPVNDEIL
jgi:hypothetical protein